MNGAATLSVEHVVVAFSLVMTRVSSFVMAAPMFGMGTVPNSVKLGLCIALSVFWMPDQLRGVAEQTTTGGGFAWAILMEAIVGFSLGYIVRLVMLPSRIAGTYVGQELGFNLGQVADPSSGAPNNEAGLLFDSLALLVFWGSDAHHAVLRMLGLSHVMLGPDREYVYGLASVFSRMLSQAHELGILMIAPLASILFLTLVSLTLLMRSWPQVTLFSFGMGARLLIGLAAFAFMIPLILTSMEEMFTTVTRSLEASMTGP